MGGKGREEEEEERESQEREREREREKPHTSSIVSTRCPTGNLTSVKWFELNRVLQTRSE